MNNETGNVKTSTSETEKTENWQLVKSIFFDALEIEESRRADFLAKLCGSDFDLRKAVEKLLAAHFKTKSFIEKPAFELASIFKSEGKRQAEKHFGHYKIVREIGVGGMGAVFLAERDDGEFRQQVAIKIIRQTLAGSEMVNRFKRERQILASLNHPNIARLLDGGVNEDGTPFLAMEFVEGFPITDFAALRDLNVREKLRLFLQVCAGISYAHQNLIVHRDLKPSNIFVAVDGTPKLLDFGLAKMIDGSLDADSSQTETAFHALTPAYASPEQLKGEPITTASDIYSLGIVLYELLTETHPFQFNIYNLEEAIRVICDTEPVRPSAAVSIRQNEKLEITDYELQEKTKEAPQAETGNQNSPLEDQKTNPKSKIQNQKLLRGDLDNIILKSLRKEPERRYKTVQEFAEDIERHLAGLPVRARPNTFSYRAEKFIKRNRLGVAAGLLILLTLIGGVAATIWQARRAEAQRLKAEKRFGDVRKLANSFLFEIYPKIENLQGATDARESLVKRALEYLDSLAQESGDNRDLQRELAAAYEKVGDVQGKPNQPNLGDTKGALTSYRKAQALRETLAENNPENLDLQHELATNYEQEGYILWWSDETEKAIGLYDKALTLRRRLIEGNPRSVEYKKGLAGLQMTYGDVPAWNNESEKALVHYREALQILENLVAEFPADGQLKAAYGRCLNRVGSTQKDAGDFKSALANLENSQAIFRTLISQDPNNYDFERGLWLARFRQCETFLYQPDNKKAVENCPSLVDSAENLVKKDPKDTRMRQDLVSSYNYAGQAFLQAGKPDEAISAYKNALFKNGELAAQFPENTEYKRTQATLNLGISNANLKLGKIDRAVENQRLAQKILEEIVGEDSQNSVPRFDLATVYKQAGEICVKERESVQARAWFARALEILQNLDAEDALTVTDKKLIPDLQNEMAKIK